MSEAAAAAAVASPTKSGGGTGGGSEDAELPKALLKRIIKARLSEWDMQQNGGDGTRDFQVNKVRPGARAVLDQQRLAGCQPTRHVVVLTSLCWRRFGNV